MSLLKRIVLLPGGIDGSHFSSLCGCPENLGLIAIQGGAGFIGGVLLRSSVIDQVRHGGLASRKATGRETAGSGIVRWQFLSPLAPAAIQAQAGDVDNFFISGGRPLRTLVLGAQLAILNATSHGMMLTVHRLTQSRRSWLRLR